VDVLGKLLDNHEHPRGIFKQHAATDEDGVLHWEEDSFRKWVTTNQRLSVLRRLCTYTLAYLRLRGLDIPLLSSCLNDSEGPALQTKIRQSVGTKAPSTESRWFVVTHFLKLVFFPMQYAILVGRGVLLEDASRMLMIIE